MSEQDRPTTLVFRAIEVLRKVLDVTHFNENCGLKAEFRFFREAWKLFKEVLGDAAPVMQSPRSGDGLRALWLRQVWLRAVEVEKFIEKYGFDNSSNSVYDHRGLEWIVMHGWTLYYQVEKRSRDSEKSLQSLLAVPRTAHDRLRDLADHWSAEFENAPVEPLSAPSCEEQQNWRPWGRKVDQYIVQASDLLTEIIVSGQIRPNWLADLDFGMKVLASLDPPCYFIRSYLTVESGDGLHELADRLAPETPHEGPQSKTPLEPYEPSENYGRDRWIYENMSSFTHQQLTVELKTVAHIKKWFPIKSRSAMKDAADKYAKHCGLRLRAFGDGQRRN